MKLVYAFCLVVVLSLVARADFEVYFLRHGETTWNRAHVLQGSLSYPRLTPRGERMAAATAEGMARAGVGFDRVYTSPLGRARQTAEFIVDGLRLPKATCDTRLREMGFGKYEGLRYEKGHWQDDNLRCFFEDLETYVPRGDGAESLEQVQVRLRGFLDEVLKPLDGQVSRVLCVTHAQVLKALERELTGAMAPLTGGRAFHRNCGIHVVRYSNGRFSLGETGRVFYDLEAFDQPHGPAMIAHRGDYVDCPEASQAAYSNAVVRGSDIVKLDVNPSKDGVTILSHDVGFKRTMGWDVRIGDVDYEEIRQHAYLPKGTCSKSGVVTLPEALEIVRAIPQFWIDFKTFTPAFGEQVLRQFREAGIDSSRILCVTYTQSALGYFQEHHPEIRRVGHIDFQLREGRWSPSFCRAQSVTFAPAEEGATHSRDLFEGILAYVRTFDLHGVNIYPDPRVVTPDFVKALKGKGLWVSIAPVHTASLAKKFANHGPDGVVTRDVQSVRPVFSSDVRPGRSPRAVE